MTLGPGDTDPDTYQIIGAAMAVHRELGCGFLEPIYREALSLEFGIRGIEANAEVSLPMRYKGTLLSMRYRVDFVCMQEIVVEVKALTRTGPIEQAQTLNYLKLSGKRRALLLNFGAPRLEYHRFVW